MKYSLYNLLLVVTVLGIMAAAFPVPSSRSVLVWLACTCGLLGWAAVSSFLVVGEARHMLGAASVAGFGYLACYVATDTPVEAWINAAAIAPFALMKGGSLTLSSAELGPWLVSTEFHFFQQKMHFVLAMASAGIAAWIAKS